MGGAFASIRSDCTSWKRIWPSHQCTASATRGCCLTSHSQRSGERSHNQPSRNMLVGLSGESFQVRSCFHTLGIRSVMPTGQFPAGHMPGPVSPAPLTHSLSPSVRPSVLQQKEKQRHISVSASVELHSSNSAWVESWVKECESLKPFIFSSRSTTCQQE